MRKLSFIRYQKCVGYFNEITCTLSFFILILYLQQNHFNMKERRGLFDIFRDKKQGQKREETPSKEKHLLLLGANVWELRCIRKSRYPFL